MTSRKTSAPKKRSAVRRRRPKQKKTGRFRVGFLLLIPVLLFIAYWWAKDAILPVVVLSATAEPGYLERSVHAKALVVRQETVYVAPVSGRLVLLVNEGERVRAGAWVAEISDPATQKAFDEQIEALDRRIAEFERSNASRMSQLVHTMKQFDTKIAESVAEARKATSLNDAARLHELDKIVRDYLDARLTASIDLARLDSVLQDLLAERQRLLELSKKTTNVIVAPGPGVVSFVLDGLERQFAFGMLEGLSARTVFTAQTSSEQSSTGDEVRAGKPILKIMGLDNVQLAVPLKAEDLVDMVAVQHVEVRSELFGLRAYAGKVVSVSEPGIDGYGLVMIGLSSFPEELFRTRVLDVELVKDRREGIVLPEECLIEKNGETGVYVVYKTMASFRKVTVRARIDGKVVVDGISPGVEVIRNHWLVREGLKVR